jgi:TusA-related sulfurtransferase
MEDVEMGDTQSKENVLDVRGTICPYPQLKTKVALDKMGPGETLKILLNDRESANNIRIQSKSTAKESVLIIKFITRHQSRK